MPEDRGLKEPSKRSIAVMVFATPWNLLGDRYGSAHCMDAGFAAGCRGLTSGVFL
jgi:hypothetical protein